MQFYVSTYKKYNNGDLSGAWFDPSDYRTYEDFMEAVKAAHSDESDPEFMVQDWEDTPNIGRHFGESLPDESAFVVLCALGDTVEAFDEYVGLIGPSKIDAGFDDNFGEAYQGEHQSEEDFAENLVEELGMLNALPENLKCYFDYERFARDLFISDYSYCNGHVFRNI